MIPFAEAKAAVKTLWGANWAGYPGVPVYWHENITNEVPSDPQVDPMWLLLGVEFDGNDLRAYGAGLGQNEHLLRGTVFVRVFTGQGGGEDDALECLGAALAVFQSRRTPELVFVGDAVFSASPIALSGNWWQRVAITVFTYRYRG